MNFVIGPLIIMAIMGLKSPEKHNSIWQLLSPLGVKSPVKLKGSLSLLAPRTNWVGRTEDLVSSAISGMPLRANKKALGPNTSNLLIDSGMSCSKFSTWFKKSKTASALLLMTTLSPSLSPPFASYATKKNRNTTSNTTERRRSIILSNDHRCSSSSLRLRRRKAMRTTTTMSSSSESESPIIMNKDDDYDESDEKTASSDDDNNGIIIIGGGLAGLAAAVQLETKNIPYVLLESSDGFGGRARTDIVDGYILDRGFAIYLSSYEECNKIFDTKALDLRKFYAGADVRFENQFYRVADPFRHVSDALPSLLPNHKIGSPLDKVLVGLVRFQTLLLRMNPMQRESSETIEERLNTFGFSEEMVDRFFRPFLGGIFFNPELTTDSRLFDFVMRSLALGENCLPAKGIGAMAEQLVGRLDEKNVHANAKVQEIRNVNDAVEVHVQMMNKEEETIIRGKKVILAVEGPECDRLLGTKDKQREKGVGTTCVYFSCDKPYDAENAMLYLDGEKYKGGGGKKTLVNNCCFPSVVSPTYAPNGKHLCSASIIGVPSELSDEQIGDRVKSELSDWFGESITSSFKLLKVYRIPFAQPIQTPSAKGSSKTAFEQTCESGAMKNVYLAGDHRDAATFDGALISGRRCAEYAKSKM